MKKEALISEITSNLKKLSDSQLADVADYIEMIMGTDSGDFFEKEDDQYADEDLDFLNDDESYSDDMDDNFY